ncbi:MAG: hypothetical protein II840_05835 [Kiritimatiellae bacterium]|nr:hypothetical protein [Kiritimatiellia bacterium]
MALLGLAGGVCGVLAAVAVSAPSRGRLETPVKAENVAGETAGKMVSASLYAAGRRPTAPNGMTFGVSEKTGERFEVVEFAKPVSIGAVYTSNPNVTFSWRESAAEDWRSMRRMTDEGRAETKAAEKGYSFWYAPKDAKAQALRVESTIPDDRVPGSDGKYSAHLGSLYVFPEPVFNVAQLGTAFASSNARRAGRIVNGKVNDWDQWSSEPNGKRVSAENAPFAGVAWASPATFEAIGVDFPMFDAVDVQVCTAKPSVHPKDAGEKDWRTVRSFKGFSNGYPTSARTTWIDLGEKVTTRGVRLLFTEPMSQKGLHPHMSRRSQDGTVVQLDELFVLSSFADAKALRKALKADESPYGIEVPFEMPFDGLASLVLETKDGRRVRNLAHARPFKAGRNTVFWDGSDDLGRDIDAARHGLYSIPYRPVNPGDYVVKGVAVKPVKPVYECSVYWAGKTPWGLPDHTGAWIANHSAPQAAAFLKGRSGAPDRVALGANVTEGPDGLAFVSLDGRKTDGRKWIGGTWTAAAFLAADNGERPVEKHVLYVGGLGTSDATKELELRLTALTEGGEDRLAKYPLVGADKKNAVGGIAAHNGIVAISFRFANEVMVTNLVSGVSLRIPVDSPRGIAFEKDDELVVLSGKSLVRVAVRDGAMPKTIVASGLDDPYGLATDAKGNFYVTDRGDSHQVKVFSKAGKVVRVIGRPGKPSVGAYDELHMNDPAELCVDSEGKVWVAECNFAPKRVSVWNAADGTLARAFYGPAKYGAGGTFDTRNERLFYYDEADSLMEFAVDVPTGRWKLARVLARPDPKYRLEKYVALPQRTVYLKTPAGERRFLTNAWNSNPVSGPGTVSLYAIKNDELEYVTSVSAPAGDRFAGAAILDDGTLTIACWLKGKNARKGRAVYVKPDFDAKGNPSYDLDKAVTVFEETSPSPSSGGNQLVCDAKGNWLITTGVEPLPTYSISGGRAGSPSWTIPNMWPGLHAGHSAPRVDTKERITAPTRLLGPAMSVGGTDFSLVALNGNHGEIYLFTSEGILFETVLKDNRYGRRWAFPDNRPGRDLTDVSPCDEHFWPTLNKFSDGKFRLVAGKDAASVVRLDNLETLTRLKPSSVRVTAAKLKEIVAERERRELSRKAREGTGRFALALSKDAPTVDGDLGEWEPASFVSIENRGVAAYFNANSKPYDIRGALRSDGKTLYAAWKTEGVKSLADNSGENPELLFKTGGGCDLMLETGGGVRILAAMVPDAKDGKGIVRSSKPLVMMYEKKVPGVKAADRVPFTSPVMTVTFDRVRDITGLVKFAAAKDGSGYELAVPLGLVSLKPAKGARIRGDIGILRGDGGATLARSYWSNKATAIVSDVPSEAELRPANWGDIVVEEAGR